MADNYRVRDGTGALVTIKAKNVGGVQATQVVPSDASGLPYSAANPLPHLPGTGTPADFSVNKPSLAGLALLATVAAGPPGSRSGGFAVQNQSADPVTVVLDNGSGGAETLFILDPAALAGGQGGALDSAAGGHTGRIQVYGVALSAVAIRVW